MYRTDMQRPIQADIHEATEADRAILARISPLWFSRHVPDIAWCALDDGQVVAGLMIESSPDGIARLEFHGVDDATIEASGPALIERALDYARESGLTCLDAYTDTLAASRHHDFLRTVDFEVHETFDTFSAPRSMLANEVRAVRDRTRGRIKSRFDADVLQMEAKHVDAVAAAMSAWIGGSANRGIFELRSRFHSRRKDDPERCLQMVAVHDSSVVGFCSTRITEPGVLKVDGDAIHPGYRLDPLQTELTMALYDRAEEIGIHTITFDAGSRQPNTRAVTQRNRIDSTSSRIHFRRNLVPTEDQA